MMSQNPSPETERSSISPRREGDPEWSLAYRLNKQDQIVYVSWDWNHFARSNSGEAVVADRVLYRSLWDFIVDLPTIEIYDRLLNRVREGRIVRYNFRCDAPGCRRLLRMEVSGLEDGSVEFHTRPIWEETREPVALLDPKVERSSDLLVVCGWCKKVSLPEGWVEVEVATERLRLFEQRPLPSVTHGICDECFEKMSKALS